jgi:hypothetical protein
MDLKEIEPADMEWIRLSQGSYQWQAPVNSGLSNSIKGGEFLDSQQ